MALNDPRTQDYNFKVFEDRGWVWLFDDSERILYDPAYPCTFRPRIWAEPVYPLCDVKYDELVECRPDSGYYLASAVGQMETIEVLVVDHTEECDQTAWDDAREEASANHPI
jgi:hypothetical protein